MIDEDGLQVMPRLKHGERTKMIEAAIRGAEYYSPTLIAEDLANHAYENEDGEFGPFFSTREISAVKSRMVKRGEKIPPPKRITWEEAEAMLG